MDLRQIRYLLEAVDCGSILAAAHRLGVPQSSVSRAIKHLEADIGVPLLERHGRGIDPTEAGRRFCDEVVPLVRELDKLHRDLSAATDSPSGTLAIGLVPSVGDSLASALIARLREQWPQIALRVQHAFSGQLTERLVAGDIDLAVTNASRAPARFHQRRLCTFDLFHITARSAVEPTDWLDGTVALPALAGHDMVLTTTNHGIRQRIEEAIDTARVSWTVVSEVDSLTLLKALVRQGVGSTILPYAALGRDAADPDLMVRRVVAPTISDALVIASAPDRPHGPAMRVVSQMIADEFRRAVADGRYIDGS